MMKKWIAIAGVAALLAACGTAPSHEAQPQPWNGGIWNSVLGYHGPTNVTAAPTAQ